MQPGAGWRFLFLLAADRLLLCYGSLWGWRPAWAAQLGNRSLSGSVASPV